MTQNVVIPKLDFVEVPCEAPAVRRAIAVPRKAYPLIAVDVTDIRGTKQSPGGTQIRIVAIFRWPTMPERGVQTLWLRKHDLVEVSNGFEYAKTLAAAFWAEHQRNEEATLEEMWKLPMMGEAELEDYRKRWKLHVRRTEEAASDVIDDRKQAVALTGGKVE
jgi:hypothetical protein